MKRFLSFFAVIGLLIACTKGKNDDSTSHTIPDGAVDIGLSVYWASCNLGASAPGEYGDYYAWGETKTKQSYSWENYQWCNGTDDSLTKYNTMDSWGTVDNKTSLEAGDDVARAKLSGKWRMPTVSELDELVATKADANYKWEWKSQNGHAGFLVTYLKNNSSIFLPAAGRYMSNVGVAGFYWTSSLDAEDPCLSWALNFTENDVRRDYNYRCDGFSIRPVSDK